MSVGQETRTRFQYTETGNDSMFSNIHNMSEECVRDYPVSSTMLALGAGAALGLLIASALGRREEVAHRSYMSQLGNQFARTIGNVVPDSLNWKR